LHRHHQIRKAQNIRENNRRQFVHAISLSEPTEVPRPPNSRDTTVVGSADNGNYLAGAPPPFLNPDSICLHPIGTFVRAARDSGATGTQHSPGKATTTEWRAESEPAQSLPKPALKHARNRTPIGFRQPSN
jgi:hypothetical protein